MEQPRTCNQCGGREGLQSYACERLGISFHLCLHCMRCPLCGISGPPYSAESCGYGALLRHLESSQRDNSWAARVIMDEEQEFFATPHHAFSSSTVDPAWSNPIPEPTPLLPSPHGSPSFLSQPAYRPLTYQPPGGPPPSCPSHAYQQQASHPPQQSAPSYPQHASYPPSQSAPTYPQRKRLRQESGPRQSGPIVSATNTVDVTPTSRVGFMNYLGPGDILRYFHAIHLLAEAGKLGKRFLILITQRLFGLAGGLLTTDIPKQEAWQYPGINAHFYTSPLCDGCTVVWLVFQKPSLILNRQGLAEIYPHLVKTFGHLFDFRTLLHYYEGNMKRWPTKDRPKVGQGRVTPVKIDRDAVMLQRVFDPARGRCTQGSWFQLQASAACVRLQILQTIEKSPGETRFQVEEWNNEKQRHEKVSSSVPHRNQIIDFQYDETTLNPQNAVLLFVRHHDAEIERNTQPAQVAALFRVATAFGMDVVLAGQPVMDDYAAFLAGCRTENIGVPNTCHAYCFKGQTLLQQMQYYASFRGAVGNNASALDLASGAGIPVFRDMEFPELAKSANYERCHNSFLRRRLNLGIKPWGMLEQEESTYAHLVPRKEGRESYPIRMTDPTSGRYPCLKTPETLETVLFYFVGAIARGRPEVTQQHHITLPDGIDLSAYSLPLLYSLATPTHALMLDQCLASMWQFFSQWEVDYGYVGNAERRTYDERLNPNFTE